MEKFLIGSSVNLTLNKFLLSFTIISSLLVAAAMPGKSRLASGPRKHFIIHIPMKIRTHHHTHTVYTHIRHDNQKGTKQTIYKIMSFAMNPGGPTPSAGSSTFRANSNAGGIYHANTADSFNNKANRDGYDEILYDDYRNFAQINSSLRDSGQRCV
uniref:Uncharacterized protein n=1 Tax=Glossina austeni TaxID=7395 RepID=A0A1A9V2U9_GLOAU